MGRVSQVIGYIFGFIILLTGIGSAFCFFGDFSIIGLLLTIFGFVIMYLRHRSRPTKEMKMLEMQAEDYFREQTGAGKIGCING